MNFKRLLCSFLAMIMILGIIPISGYAAAEPNSSMTIYYDDYLDATIVEAGTDSVNSSNAVLETTESGVHAIGLGSAKVKIDGAEYVVTVVQAPVEIMLVMGQSNACELYCTEYQKIECAVGTAYKWGQSSTSPAAMGATKGWHSALAAEWYAQSGIKPVLVYENNVTTQNGSPLAGRESNNTTGWITNDKTLTTAAETTVTMVNTAYEFFDDSSYYTVNGCGLYWYQGEGDATQQISYYYEQFSSLWSQLKEKTSLSYCGFFRLRNGTPLDYVNSAKAQYQLANDNEDIYIASNITESWTAEGEYDPVTIETENFKTISRNVDGTVITKVSYDTRITTTMHYLWGFETHGNKHACQLGYNLMGADAAYNMYSALYGDAEYAVEMMQPTVGADSRVTQIATAAGSTGSTISLEAISDDIVFYLAPGSGSAELQISVTADGADVTDSVVLNELNGMLSLTKLKSYDNVSVIAKVVENDVVVATTTYNFVKNYSEATSYRWDFNDNTLNAYDENGEVANAFETNALAGDYVFKNGIMYAEDLTYGVQLKLAEPIVLAHDKDWSIEWCLTSYGNGGNLFSTHDTATGAEDEWMILHSRDRASLSNLRQTTIFYFYGASAKAGKSLDGKHGDVLLMTNNYNEETGKNIISLYKNGELWVEDFSVTGDYSGHRAYTEAEWENEYLTGTDITFNYLGALRAPNWTANRLFKARVDYIEVTLEGAHTHSFSTEWNCDEEYHWHECEIAGCTETCDKDEHSDEETGLCSVCGNVNYSGATSYTWDFNDSLYAYDEIGKIANGFDATPLAGTVMYENGTLRPSDYSSGLSLALDIPIELDHTKNWSIEYKVSAFKQNGALFASSSSPKSGEWVIYNNKTRHSITYYQATSTLINYGASNNSGVATNNSNSATIKYVNTYNEEDGTNIISLYIDDTLKIENICVVGDSNGSSALSDTQKTNSKLSGTDIVFSYLGNSTLKMAAQIDYIKVDLGS